MEEKAHKFGVRRIKAVLAYDGTDFSGWQYQPGVLTVQGRLEEAIEKVVHHPLRVVAAGRTDTGVHALGQVVHFKTITHLPPEVMLRAFNANLPPSIRVRRVEDSPRSFHARFSASSRVYRYLISNLQNPFLCRYCWISEKRLDINAINEAVSIFLGEHNFAAFGTPMRSGGSTTRKIMRAEAKRVKGVIIITLEANAFLKRMARFIVGSVMKVAMGRLSLQELEKALLCPEEGHCSAPLAPPHGLFLWRVKYGD